MRRNLLNVKGDTCRDGVEMGFRDWVEFCGVFQKNVSVINRGKKNTISADVGKIEVLVEGPVGGNSYLIVSVASKECFSRDSMLGSRRLAL